MGGVGRVLPAGVVCLLLVSSAVAGSFGRYVPAYNELVRMIHDRCEVTGRDCSSLELKVPADPTQASLTQIEVEALRTATANLFYDFLDTEDFNLGPHALDDRYEAFPTLSETITQGFLVIPAHHTSDNRAIYSKTFSGNWNQVPILFEQLQDIYDKL
ncbi:MAG: hypothetical protein O3A51_04080, partial [Verrucomicrobia bacterium]|nr:hypothetical protein [Verrucomicrobiota bacterium]